MKPEPTPRVEQIKLDIAHDNLPVVLLGDGAGFVYSHLGTSHQSTEDIACTRAVPALTVYSPADRFELAACMTAAYALRSPVYLRMGKSDRGDVHDAPCEIRSGELKMLRPHHDGGLAIVATGSMVRTALDVAGQHFPDASVWSAPVVKPLNVRQIVNLCRLSAGMVVIEEHSVLGGLGSAICEIASESTPLRILRVGVADRFSEKCGTYDYLLREHGLDAAAVHARIDTFASELVATR